MPTARSSASGLVSVCILRLAIASCVQSLTAQPGQLDREGITYDVVDIEQDPGAAEIVESANNGNQTVPTLVYADGTAQTNPSLKQVQDKLANLTTATA